MINFNGTVIDKSTLSFSKIERLLYGDGFFETMKIINGNIFNYPYHLDRINLGIKIFKLNFKPHPNFIPNEIKKLNLNKKKAYRLRIIFIREVGGKYIPTSNNYTFFIESEELNTSLFQLNNIGKSINISTIPIYSKTLTNNIKSIGNNNLVFNGLQKITQTIDELVFENENMQLTECTSSNIFIIKGKHIYTPPIDSGCVKGTMRSFILTILPQLNLTAPLNQYLTKIDLENADEVFISNAIQGVQWIRNYKDYIFDNTYSKKIIALLNNKVNSRL